MDESGGPGEQPRRGHETSDASIRNLIIFRCRLVAFWSSWVSWSVEPCSITYVGHPGIRSPGVHPLRMFVCCHPEPRLQVTAPKDLEQYKAAQERNSE